MIQINIHGPDDVRLDEVPEPEPGGDDVVVRVDACGICGSDLGYISLGGVAGPSRDPMPLGHEMSGVVESVGDNVTEFEPGTRVVVNPIGSNNQIGNGGPEGAFAPKVLVRNVTRDRCLFAIPDDMTSESAALAEPLGVGMRAVDRVSVLAGEKVVVFGAGPIGLAAVATLHYRGVRDVIAVDYSEMRLEIARKLGAEVTLNPGSDDIWKQIREIHGTSPVLGAPMSATDAYIEASGASPLIGQVLANAKTEARLSIVALHRAEVPVSFLLLMMKQMSVAGSMGYPEDWSAMIEMLSNADLSPMITHRYALGDFTEALAVAQDPAAGGKVMIEP